MKGENEKEEKGILREHLRTAVRAFHMLCFQVLLTHENVQFFSFYVQIQCNTLTPNSRILELIRISTFVFFQHK